jgi:thymidine phosphorylase
VREGDVLLTLHTDTPERFERAEAALEGGIEVDTEGTGHEAGPVVLDRIA